MEKKTIRIKSALASVVTLSKGQIITVWAWVADAWINSGIAEEVKDGPEGRDISGHFPSERPIIAKSGEGEKADDKDSLTASDLPEDFPGRAELIAGGLTTVASVRECDDLVDIPGIGAATETKILEALQNLPID